MTGANKAQDGLHTYLNKHLAGGSGAIEMAEHCRSANAGEPLAQFLEDLVVEIQADHQTLQGLRESPDALQNRVKQVTAPWARRCPGSRWEAGTWESPDPRNLVARHRRQSRHVEVPEGFARREPRARLCRSRRADQAGRRTTRCRRALEARCRRRCPERQGDRLTRAVESRVTSTAAGDAVRRSVGGSRSVAPSAVHHRPLSS